MKAKTLIVIRISTFHVFFLWVLVSALIVFGFFKYHSQLSSSAPTMYVPDYLFCGISPDEFASKYSNQATAFEACQRHVLDQQRRQSDSLKELKEYEEQARDVYKNLNIMSFWIFTAWTSLSIFFWTLLFYYIRKDKIVSAQTSH